MKRVRRTKSHRPAEARRKSLGRRDGSMIRVEIHERSGSLSERVAGEGLVRTASPAVNASADASKRLPRGTSIPAAVTDAFAAAGHPVRAKLLSALLGGPATYQAIQRMTGLAPGPLYHHANQMRLAGLIMPRQRDLYELTRAGRNLALLLVAAKPLLRDRRRRPLG